MAPLPDFAQKRNYCANIQLDFWNDWDAFVDCICFIISELIQRITKWLSSEENTGSSDRYKSAAADPKMSDVEIGKLMILGAGALWGAYKLYKFMRRPSDEDERHDDMIRRDEYYKNLVGQDHNSYVYESIYGEGQGERQPHSPCHCTMFMDFHRDLLWANPSGHAPGCINYRGVRPRPRTAHAQQSVSYEAQQPKPQNFENLPFYNQPVRIVQNTKACKNVVNSSSVAKQPELRNLEDLPFYNQPVRIVWNAKTCKKAVNKLRQHCSEFPVLGLDCEWNTWYGREPVALLQLATHRGLCVLIRLCEMETIPIELHDLLYDATVKKVGVLVERDMKYLCEDYQLEGRGALDLRILAMRCGYPGPQGLGLASMAEKSLGVKMDKTWQRSDWEAERLSAEQIKYAANDARVSIELFRKYAKTLFLRSALTSQESWIRNVLKHL